MPRARSSGQELVDRRPDPLAGLDLDADEPVVALGQLPSALERPPSGRRPRRPPSASKRANRQISVTFTSPEVPDRLRRLAQQWELYAPHGAPNVSAVAEYLIMLSLTAAEQGEIPPPSGQKGQR